MGLSRVQSTLPSYLDELIYEVIGCALEVHRHLGPGFLESIYEKALLHELNIKGISHTSQKEVSIPYKGIELTGQRLDLLVNDCLVVELKAVDRLLPIHEAQLISYLKSLHLRAGLLINFHALQLKDGLKRIVL